MELFCGVGGLSLGLEEAGAIDAKWCVLNTLLE
jgi:site-specific DNA-cytosine methylase